MKNKKCTKCQRLLPVTSFVKDSTKKDGIYSSCKDCYRRRYPGRQPQHPGNSKKRKCIICEKEFIPTNWQVSRNQGKFCSNKCKFIGISGKNNKNWKSRTLNGGYVYIREEDTSPLRREHIVIIEKQIGRKLKPNERIHHINGIKCDNRIKNLFLCNSSTHQLAHTSVNDLLDYLLSEQIIIFDRKKGKYVIIIKS